jgi:hypothetical protein
MTNGRGHASESKLHALVRPANGNSSDAAHVLDGYLLLLQLLCYEAHDTHRLTTLLHADG